VMIMLSMCYSFYQLLQIIVVILVPRLL